ncbi:unnamed protein product [Amoebophrya sp. A25]|nr:unnamed protein product [Amoebophrya sp. A25]|eukprot:GSA25T00025091001.1
MKGSRSRPHALRSGIPIAWIFFVRLTLPCSSCKVVEREAATKQSDVDVQLTRTAVVDQGLQPRAASSSAPEHPRTAAAGATLTSKSTRRRNGNASTRRRKANYQHSAVLVLNSTLSVIKEDNFVCATLDWWPPFQVDFGRKPWTNGTTIPHLVPTKITPFVKGLSTRSRSPDPMHTTTVSEEEVTRPRSETGRTRELVVAPSSAGSPGLLHPSRDSFDTTCRPEGNPNFLSNYEGLRILGDKKDVVARAQRETAAGSVIRIGGSPGDRVTYEEPLETFEETEAVWRGYAEAHSTFLPKSALVHRTKPEDCHDFRPDPSTPSKMKFSSGCLTMAKWTSLLEMCEAANCRILFQLNALYGVQRVDGANNSSLERLPFAGHWNPRNAFHLMYHTIHVLKKAHLLIGFELGNELGPMGMGKSGKPSIFVEHYAQDYRVLRQMINWFVCPPAWRMFGVASNFDVPWLRSLEQLLKDPLFVFTHHMYSLGSANSSRNELVEGRILNATYLESSVRPVATATRGMLQTFPGTQVWMGEAGGAYGSGAPGVTNDFLSGFWFLDQLATFAGYGQNTHYCRQTLVGAFYEMVDKATLLPNPDWYVASLFNFLIRKRARFVTVAVDDVDVRNGRKNENAGLTQQAAPSAGGVLRRVAVHESEKDGHGLAGAGDGSKLRIHATVEMLTGPQIHDVDDRETSQPSRESSIEEEGENQQEQLLTSVTLTVMNLSETDDADVTIGIPEVDELREETNFFTARESWIFESVAASPQEDQAAAKTLLNGRPLLWKPTYESAAVWIDEFVATKEVAPDDKELRMEIPKRSYGFVRWVAKKRGTATKRTRPPQVPTASLHDADSIFA